jgi:glucokinase
MMKGRSGLLKILALDIGGTMIKSAIVDDHGRIAMENEVPSEGKQGGTKLLENAFKLVSTYNDYDRIGISTTGQVNPADGSIKYANDNVPQFIGTPIKEIFENRFGVPTAVLNDVHAAALGEAHYGVGKRFSDFICLTYGTGVGGAIIIEKKVYFGGFGVAGEFGHIITHPDGLICGCGQRGCYEQYASTTALVKKAMEVNPECVNGRIVFQILEKGSKDIKRVVDAWIQEVILGLRSLIPIFNPSCVVMGGGIMREDYILSFINERIYDYLNPGHRGVKIIKAELGNHAGLLGASIYVSDGGKKQ